MKKKMVTMLMLVMMTMTACGGKSNENIEVNETNTETSTETTVTEQEETKKSNETVTVDDVHFDGRDIIIKGGSTYTVNSIYTSPSPNYPFEKKIERLYKLNSGDMDVLSHVTNYINNELESDLMGQQYYDDTEKIRYYGSKNDNIFTKENVYQTDGYDSLINSYRGIFDLPWTLESETDSSFIFTLSDDTNFEDILEKYEMNYSKNPQFKNIEASYIFNKDGTKLQTINVDFDIARITDDKENYFDHYHFDLTASDIGNTIVEIPEDIIENAVEK